VSARRDVVGVAREGGGRQGRPPGGPGADWPPAPRLPRLPFLVRRLPVLAVALLAVLALVATGCGSGSTLTAAATVDGEAISEDELLADLEALSSDEGVRAAIEGQGVEVYGPNGEPSTYGTTFASQVLSVLIVDELISQEVEARGIVPTPEQQTAAQQQFDEGYGQFAQVLPEDYRARQVDAIANRVALSEALAAEQPAGEVTDEDVERYYQDNIDRIMEQGDFACSSHILIGFTDPPSSTAEPTPDQEAAALAAAEDAGERIEAGEEFEAVAAEVSDDTQSAQVGGDLGCSPRSGQFVPEFEDAVFSQSIGEVGEPVRTAFGYHVILVRSRGVLPLDEVRDDIRQILEDEQSAGSEAVLSRWITERSAEVSVEVDPRWGTWDAAQGLVVPPEGASEPGAPGTPEGLTGIPGADAGTGDVGGSAGP
jgi:parvulin-like peptidyl-prolyl isomerase